MELKRVVKEGEEKGGLSQREEEEEEDVVFAILRVGYNIRDYLMSEQVWIRLV